MNQKLWPVKRPIYLQVLAVFFLAVLLLQPTHAQNKKYTAIGDSLTVNNEANAADGSEPEAPSLIVNSNADVMANDGQTTLREAIAYARTFPANQTPNVTFAANVTGTILLSGSNINISRPFSSNLTISGPGASALSLDGNAQSNIFTSDGVGNATITGLTFTNGLAAKGGAIQTVPNAEDNEISGTLSLTDCVFTANRATIEAGAINGGCVLRLLRCSFLNNRSDQFQGAIQFFSYPQNRPSSATDCVFSGNSAQFLGGAITITSDGATALTNCVFTDNSVTGASRGGALHIDTDFDDSVTITNCIFNNNRVSSGQGGAINLTFCSNFTLLSSQLFDNRAQQGGAINIAVAGTATLNRCALYRNTASGDGGGVFSAAPLSLVNSTISGNTASANGGGIFLNSTQSATTLSAQFTTIATNSAANGGGIYLGDNRQGNLSRSIVASNEAPTNPDVRGAFTSGGFNVIGNLGSATGFTSSDRTGTIAAPLDARLGTLADNGGATLTHALLAGSPALDLATPVAGITMDQRGVARPSNGNVDAGAYEAQFALALDLNGNDAGTGLTTTFIEQTPKVIAPALVISNATNLSSASVQLGENPDNAGETLSATVAGTSISANYNSATRTLTLSGADTSEHYRQVLAGVTYNNLSDTPNTTNRTLVFSISDGGQSSSAPATLQVSAVNDAPVATAQTLATNEDTPKTIALGATDVDTPSANLTFRIVTPPAHGTLSGSAPNLIYTPQADFNGADAFTFVANDGASDSNIAQIALQVLAINDAPIALANSVSTNEDTPLNIALSATDIDTPSANLIFRIVAAPQHGALSGRAPNLIYTPDANFNGVDTFTFVANDGASDSNVAQIALQVLAINDAPVAMAQRLNADNATPLQITLGATDIDNDALSFAIISGPNNGTLSGNAPNLIYTAKPGFRGSNAFTFRVSDGAATSEATVEITVSGAAAVSAQADNYNLILGAINQTQQSGVVLLSSGVFQIGAPGVLRNDSFPVGSNLTVRAISNPQNGRFQLRNDGTLFYLPSTGKIGVDEFTYAISDGKTSATARVRVNVIDQRAPELAFDTPRDRETVSQFSKIAGRVRDRNAGLKTVTLLWQRFDGKFWNGKNWVGAATELPLVVQDIDWIYNGNVPKPGANAAMDLLAGRYDLRVSATDQSDNINRVTNRIIVAQSASEMSNVRLSSASASLAQNALVLNFTAALDPKVAGEPMNYTLAVSGKVVEIGAANYGNSSVTLSGLSLKSGDRIELRIENLRDASGKALQSGSIQLIAR